MSEWIDFNLPYYQYNNKETFMAKGLSRAGTLIEVESDHKLEQYLIGDINEHCGVCDDCTAFGFDSIVTRYKIVWQK